LFSSFDLPMFLPLYFTTILLSIGHPTCHNYTLSLHDALPIFSRNGSPPEAYESGWKDTILVPPGEAIKIEIEFSQPGIFMMHCHILEHEDNGMMGQILVE